MIVTERDEEETIVRWLSSNWIWLVVVGGMLWMHLGMHRGHGGHGGHGGQSHRDHDVSTAPREQGSASGEGSHDEHGSAQAATSSHRHRGC